MNVNQEAIDRLGFDSVVMDRHGHLWKLSPQGWGLIGTPPIPADRLLNRFGPVTVLPREVDA